MGFTTKLDYSDNRQIKQHIATHTDLSGGTSFGVSFADLPLGPDLPTSGVIETYNLLASTFYGDDFSSTFSWFDSRMSLGEYTLSAITPSTSATTQIAGPTFAPSVYITVDGNLIPTAYTGVTYDVSVITMTDLGGGTYSGTVETETFDVLSAGTNNYTGRTIWVDVSGKTRTEELIITKNPNIGDVFTCIDSEGLGAWMPNSISSGNTDVYVTGGTYSSGTATFMNNTGGTFSVTGFSTGSSGSTYWSAGTGTNAIVTINSNNLASGTNSLAFGLTNIASGPSSHAQGTGTISSGITSHSEGDNTIAGGNASHSEGTNTIASGSSSHAEGTGTIALGSSSHAEGGGTIASGTSSHAEGNGTQANGNYSHAGGSLTISNGTFSFVHGANSVVNGNNSIVLGANITGDSSNTTYVENLNIKTVPSGPGTIDIGVDAIGNVVNQASDIRLKENINTIENALETVLKLRGVTYNWKNRISGGNNLKIGLIAQEVLEVIPELVSNNGEYLGVQYKDIPALLIEAIKELVNTHPEIGKVYLETQTILAEDNNIELNYNGTKETAIGGGIKVLREDLKSSDLVIDSKGNWVSNTNIYSEGFVIPEYTPTNSNDTAGIEGNITRDENYIYIKTKSVWKRIGNLEIF